MNKIPIGVWVQDYVSWLTSRFESQFRFFSDGLSYGMEAVINGLISVPPVLFILIFTLLVFILKRDWKLILITLFGMALILNLGYWRETLETGVMVFFATLTSVVIGVPLGIICAHHPRVYLAVRPFLDLMQTIPTFVYLIPTLMLFGLGLAPGLISTVVFAMPATIRLTHFGISTVPHSLLEVADSFGATRWKRLWSVEIPSAFPSILNGISQCVMLSLSMVVIAALVGADGLGKPVVQALNTVNIAKGFESGIAIVIVAIILDRILVTESSKVEQTPC